MNAHDGAVNDRLSMFRPVIPVQRCPLRILRAPRAWSHGQAGAFVASQRPRRCRDATCFGGDSIAT